MQRVSLYYFWYIIFFPLCGSYNKHQHIFCYRSHLLDSFHSNVHFTVTATIHIYRIYFYLIGGWEGALNAVWFLTGFPVCLFLLDRIYRLELNLNSVVGSWVSLTVGLVVFFCKQWPDPLNKLLHPWATSPPSIFSSPINVHTFLYPETPPRTRNGGMNCWCPIVQRSEAYCAPISSWLMLKGCACTYITTLFMNCDVEKRLMKLSCFLVFWGGCRSLRKSCLYTQRFPFW